MSNKSISGPSWLGSTACDLEATACSRSKSTDFIGVAYCTLLQLLVLRSSSCVTLQQDDRALAARGPKFILDLCTPNLQRRLVQNPTFFPVLWGSRGFGGSQS
eukprot:5153085-Amphidinium_carterae.1